MAINDLTLPLINDLAFHYVFGEVEGLFGLEAMLNAFFASQALPRVTGLRLRDPRIGPLADDDKDIRLDILALDEIGRYVDIEIQTYRQECFFERSLFYWSRIYSRQLKTGADYNALRPVICVNILDFKLLESTGWYHVERLSVTDHLQFHLIELPKLPELSAGARSGDSEVLREAEKWAKFIAAAGRDEATAARLAAADTMLAAVDRRFREFMAIDGRFLAAMAREKAVRDQRGIMAYAEKEAEAKGLAKGQAKGLAEGLAQGRAETAAEIAAALARRGVDPELIKQVTGFEPSPDGIG